MEFPESPQFGHVGGNCHELEPPSTIGALEIILQALGTVGGDCGFCNVKVGNEPPCIGPPGEFGSGCHSPLEEDGFLDDWIGAFQEVSQVLCQTDGGRDVSGVHPHLGPDPQHWGRGM